jgi:hypothetical protein
MFSEVAVADRIPSEATAPGSPNGIFAQRQDTEPIQARRIDTTSGSPCRQSVR